MNYNNWPKVFTCPTCGRKSNGLICMDCLIKQTDPETADQAYRDAVDRVKAHYERPILNLLRRLAASMNECGYTTTRPADVTTGDTYEWRFEAWPRRRHIEELTVSVTFEMDESLATEGEHNGIAFKLELIGCGGTVVAIDAPFNYTPSYWVSLADHAQIEERFQMMQRTNVPALLSELKRHTTAAAQKWLSAGKA